MTSWPGWRCVGNHLDRGDDVGQVRVLRLAERRRHADVDRVERRDDRRVASWRDSRPALRNSATSRRRHVRDVRLAAVDGVDLPGVEVDAGGLEAGARELDGERQADIAEADDADVGGAAVSFCCRASAAARQGRTVDSGHGV